MHEEKNCVSVCVCAIRKAYFLYSSKLLNFLYNGILQVLNRKTCTQHVERGFTHMGAKGP